MKTKLNSTLNQLRRTSRRLLPPSTLHLRSSLLAALALAFVTALAARAQTPIPPVVTGVTASPRAGYTGSNSVVDIGYTNSDANFTHVNVFVLASKDSGATWTIPAPTCAGDFGPNVSVGVSPAGKAIVWSAGQDWGGNYTTNCRVRVLANNVGLVLIPPGYYLRGNAMSADTDITDAPQYPVYVSAFYMDSLLVTGGKWNLVVQSYAMNNGYTFENAGSFKGLNHPVQSVNWLDCVKWCNARSEMEGITPVYRTDGTYATVLRTGAAGSTTPFVKPGANGYRLPTEAEWEKAARGGATGHRFPWTYTDNIASTNANYASGAASGYDNGGTQTYATGAQPWTSPAGSFPANGYYLYDMAGNVFEWCWDWYPNSGVYYASGQTDPQGPGSGSVRVLRGGSWYDGAVFARCAVRVSDSPSYANVSVGFRCVRGVP